MSAWHFMDKGRDGIPIVGALCRRVPDYASTTTDEGQVTCKWCLRIMRIRNG